MLDTIMSLIGAIGIVLFFYTLRSIISNNVEYRKRKKFTVIQSEKPKKRKRIIMNKPIDVDPRYEDYINAAWDEINN